MTVKYIVLCGQVVGSEGQGFEIVYGFDGQKFKERADAISHGFEVRGSDDFNIGVLNGKSLVSLDWMDKPVDTALEVLRPIAQSLGFST